jgi:hypothetical protein
MWSDILTVKERESTERAIEALRSVDWAYPLVRRIEEEGGLIERNMPFMFETRYAYELHLAGATADYEFSAGVGKSTIDFRIHGNPEWLVELVSLRVSNAIKRATKQNGLSSELFLQTNADDKTQSIEGEILAAQKRIGEKVFVKKRGVHTKFPQPSTSIHMILVDMRGFCGLGGGDANYYKQIAYGAASVPRDKRWAVSKWEGKPIKGIFESILDHPHKAAPIMQERIHFIGFVAEKDYQPGEIRDNTTLFSNPNLHPTEEACQKAYNTYCFASK